VDAATRPVAERYPAFKRHLRAAVIPGEAAYLLSPSGVTALHGRHIQVLAPLLDGRRTLAAVVREAAPAVPAPDVGRILGRLAEANLIALRESAVSEHADADEAFWDLAGLDGPLAASSLARTPVLLLAIGGVDTGQARDACQASGLRVLARPDDADPAAFTLVLCDDYLAPELAAVDAAHRAAGRPWLLAKPCGPEPWIGPIFQPGAGPCWSCLAERLSGHRRAELFLRDALGPDHPARYPEASIAAARSVATQLAVLETAKWLAGVRAEDQQTVYTLDTLTLHGRRHVVTRRPQCPQCGDPRLITEQVLRPVEVRSRRKAAGGGNNDRAVSAERMLENHSALISPVTGIVAELRRDQYAPDFVHCYVSGPNLAMHAQSMAHLRAGLRNQSGGKGVTRVDAEASALCEAVERYSATRQGDEPVVEGSYEELRDIAVHPDSCRLYHERQLRGRRLWNATHSRFHYIAERFNPKARHEWTPVWSLTSNTQRLLPTAMLYYSRSRSGATAAFTADSNGNAAGSSLEDAIVQGFLELVERDAVAVWWYNRTRQPAIDLDAFDEPWLAELRDGYERIGRHMWALDLTSDLGVPVVAAVSRQAGGAGERIIFGFGAHFDPRIALRRAVTEMGQLLSTALGCAATDQAPSDPDLRSWWQTATIEDQSYLAPDLAERARTPADAPYTPSADLRDDVDACTSLARRHGMDLLVLDQTRPDIGIPVVRVVVPGLRHFWARFAPGRLYDVPVALGRLAKATRYENLNPIPLFV
jgi:bacteriocin biosynthesis cyclodehydratase domain-containing protein